MNRSRLRLFAIVAALVAASVLVAVQASASGGDDRRGVKELADLPVLCLATPIDTVIEDLEAAIELWDSCLTDDYSFEFVFFPGGPSIVCPGSECPVQGASSRAELRALFAADNFAAAGYLATQHQMLNVLVDRSGSTAVVAAYIQANHFLADNSVDIFWGDYTIDAVKERGRWKVSHEVIVGTSFLNFEGAPVGGAPEASPLSQAVEAIGGEEALIGLERLEITSTGATWIAYEAPQPDGLMETTTYARTYTFDLAAEALRVDVDRQTLFEAFQFNPPQSFSMVLDGNVGGITDGAGTPAGNIPSSAVAALSKQQRLFNPHSLLREALAQQDLVGDGGTADFEGRSHRILTIADDIAEIRLFVDADTGLISKLETVENNPLVRDTSLEVRYKDWQAQGSLMFPNTVELYVGGALVHEETRTAVELEPSLPAGHFDLPPEADPAFFDAEDFAFGEQSHHVVEGFFALGFFFDPQPGLAPPAELAEGLTLLATGANTLVVDIDDGQVVIDAPFSPAHGTDIVDAVGQLSSDPITHVVQSHHHIDHASGVRSLVAAGATVVVGNGVGDFWNDVLSAESTIRPDALSLSGVTGLVEELESEGTFVLADDDITVTVYHTPANPHVDDNVITTIETGGEMFLYQADLYNAGFGFTLVIGGQASLFDAMRDLGIIDASCDSAVPLTIVPAHGVPTTLEDSLTELAGIGVDVGC